MNARVATKTVLFLSIMVGVSLLILAFVGHSYRYHIDIQTQTWNDGVNTYTFYRAPSDTFDLELYNKIRSVNDAVDHIKAGSLSGTEEELLIAAYDLVRKRYMHFMYPHHTWLTNPYLKFAETLMPEKPYDSMAPADVKLRHSAVAPCGGTATTFIEIYRKLGGLAQFVSFDGHDVVEAIADGKKYSLDADLETLAPYSIEDFTADPALMSHYYSHRSEEEIEHYLAVFQSEPIYMGYGGIPSSSPRVYLLQQAVEYGKFFVPLLIIIIVIAKLFRMSKVQ